MERRTFIGFIGALILLVTPQVAAACSCIGYEDAEEGYRVQAQLADVIFQGRVETIETDEEERTRMSFMSVEKYWKGNEDAFVEVHTAMESAACGIDFLIGETYIVFASENEDGDIETGLCSGTMNQDRAADLIAFLNENDIEEEDSDDGEASSHSSEESSSEERDCTPYRCQNGDTFPRCDDEHEIAYLVAPCSYSGGELSDGEEPPANGFSDVSDDHPYGDAIVFVKERGIVHGHPDGTFRPHDFIDRAAFTKIIITATKEKRDIDQCRGELEFADITTHDWFHAFVCVAHVNGIINGYPDGTFKPGNFVNFAEAAKIVVIAFGIAIEEEDLKNADSWWRPYVLTLAKIGGLPSSFSDPNQALTRGDMAEIIYRLMQGMENGQS